MAVTRRLVSIARRTALPIPELDITVVPITKSASGSVVVAVEPVCPEPTWVYLDRIKTRRAVAMFRHPTERAWSAYKFIQGYATISEEESTREPGRGDSRHDRYYPRTDQPWDAFLHTLAENYLNPHLWGVFLPQHEFCKCPDITTMVPWDFPRMSEILGREIPRANKGKDRSPTPDITPEMQYHLNIVYGADYRIWESIA